MKQRLAAVCRDAVDGVQKSGVLCGSVVSGAAVGLSLGRFLIGAPHQCDRSPCGTSECDTTYREVIATYNSVQSRKSQLLIRQVVGCP